MVTSEVPATTLVFLGGTMMVGAMGSAGPPTSGEKSAVSWGRGQKSLPGQADATGDLGFHDMEQVATEAARRAAPLDTSSRLSFIPQPPWPSSADKPHLSVPGKSTGIL